MKKGGSEFEGDGKYMERLKRSKENREMYKYIIISKVNKMKRKGKLNTKLNQLWTLCTKVQISQ